MDAGKQESLAQIGDRISKQFTASLGLVRNENDETTINRPELINEMQRFELWAVNLGLYHKGHSSLDYRFRDSPPLLKYAYGLLRDLEGSLKQFEHELKLDQACSPDAAKGTVEEDEGSDPPTDGDDDSEGEDLSSYQTENLSRVYLQNIIATVDRLYRLSFRVRSPAMRIGLSKALKYTEVDPGTGVDLIDEYAALDRNHLVELFRSYGRDVDNLEGNYLIQRLAKANTRRRQQFRYWRRRKAKFLAHSKPADEDAPRESRNGACHTHPMALNLDKLSLQHPKLSIPSTATKLGPVNVDWDDDTSMVSTNTFVMMADDSKDADKVPIPAPPIIGTELKEFECPFCFTMCARKTFVKSWEAHIFRDLRPYICTYKDCKEQDQQYDSLTDWITHETLKHRNVSSQPNHQQTLASSRNSDEHAKVSKVVDPERECPFCLIPNAKPAHVASHLRRIACFALPRWGADKHNDSEAGSGNSGKAEPDSRDCSSDGSSLRGFSWETWAEGAEHAGKDRDSEERGENSADIGSGLVHEGVDGISEIPVSAVMGAAPAAGHDSATKYEETSTSQHGMSFREILDIELAEGAYHAPSAVLKDLIADSQTHFAASDLVSDLQLEPESRNDKRFIDTLYRFVLMLLDDDEGGGNNLIALFRTALIEQLETEAEELDRGGDNPPTEYLMCYNLARFVRYLSNMLGRYESVELRSGQPSLKELEVKLIALGESYAEVSRSTHGAKSPRGGSTSHETVGQIPFTWDVEERGKQLLNALAGFSDSTGSSEGHSLPLSGHVPPPHASIHDERPSSKPPAQSTSQEPSPQQVATERRSVWDEIPLSANLNTAKSPLEKLGILEEYFDEVIEPLCLEYIEEPPVDQKTRDLKRRRIRQTTMQQLLLKMYSIDIEGDGNVRERKEALISKLRQLFNIVDGKPRSTDSPQSHGGRKSSEEFDQTLLAGGAEAPGKEAKSSILAGFSASAGFNKGHRSPSSAHDPHPNAPIHDEPQPLRPPARSPGPQACVFDTLASSLPPEMRHLWPTTPSSMHFVTEGPSYACSGFYRAPYLTEVKAGQYACPMCLHRSIRKRDIFKHMTSRNSAVSYHCYHGACGGRRTFTRRHKYTEHLRKRHPGAPHDHKSVITAEVARSQHYPETCLHCPKLMHSFDHWFDHWFSAHNDRSGSHVPPIHWPASAVQAQTPPTHLVVPDTPPGFGGEMETCRPGAESTRGMPLPGDTQVHQEAGRGSGKESTDSESTSLCRVATLEFIQLLMKFGLLHEDDHSKYASFPKGFGTELESKLNQLWRSGFDQREEYQNPLFQYTVFSIMTEVEKENIASQLLCNIALVADAAFKKLWEGEDDDSPDRKSVPARTVALLIDLCVSILVEKDWQMDPPEAKEGLHLLSSELRSRGEELTLAQDDDGWYTKGKYLQMKTGPLMGLTLRTK